MKLTKLANKRIIDFVATVPEVPDKEHEKMDDINFDESMDLWLLQDGPINLEHSNKKVGKGIRWWKDKYQGKDAFFVRGIINEDPLGDKAWNGVLTKKYKDVSIGGVSLDPQHNADGTTSLDKTYVAEISLCEDGMHPMSDIIDFNEVAKPNYKFFAKAVITNKTEEINTYTAGSTGEADEKKECGGIKMPEEIKKENPAPVSEPEVKYVTQEQFSALEAKVAEILTALKPAPTAPVEGAQKAEEKPEDKKEEATKAEDKKPEEEKKPEEDMAKMKEALKAELMVELKKSFEVKAEASTPRPNQETVSGATENLYELVKANKPINPVEFMKQRREAAQRELDAVLGK